MKGYLVGSGFMGCVWREYDQTERRPTVEYIAGAMSDLSLLCPKPSGCQYIRQNNQVGIVTKFRKKNCEDCQLSGIYYGDIL